ncbi:hypothetical protein B0I31_102363 [Saccharothrix carnea]|uniref:PPC domain-containing protein n=1 Tax=Saccharothrix carnea TaxID=1280637 RepID=A0A2P8IFY3_SACCR|nr:DUF296 domain-containing protein [Saccharothrix carnea]PSL57385.1 hypothetical protein B0I31_102363 [Saccharothrix carnea]
MARHVRLDAEATRAYAIVMQTGDSVVEELLAFARERQLRTTSFTAIGAFSRCTLAFYDLDTKEYLGIPVEEQAEVVSLVGDVVGTDVGDWQVHAHAVLGLWDGTAKAGHLRHAVVRPTLEVMLTESPRGMTRRFDPDSGLALLDLDAGEPVTDPDPLRHGLAPATGEH